MNQVNPTREPGAAKDSSYGGMFLDSRLEKHYQQDRGKCSGSRQQQTIIALQLWNRSVQTIDSAQPEINRMNSRLIRIS
ncbi:MAG: hypothetical protein V2A56_02400, partial [bacterium]